MSGVSQDAVVTRRPTPRVRASVALPVCAAAGLVLVLVPRWGGQGAVGALELAILAALSGYAVCCAALAARSSSGSRRRAWATMAAALVAWTIAQTLWFAHGPVLARTVCYIVFTALATLAIEWLPTGPTDRSWLRRVLDGVTVLLCLFLLSWTVILHRVFDSGRQSGVTPALPILTWVGDLFVLTAALMVLVRADARHRRVAVWVTAAFLAMATTHSAVAFLVLSGRYQTGSLVDLGWAASMVALSVAALLSRQSAPPPRPSASVPSNSSLWLPYVPLLLAGTVGPVLIMSGLERILVPLVVVSVCLRQVVGAWENSRLLAAAADRALRDPLTGLANRTLFHDRLEHAMTLRRRDGRSVAVVSIDLDDFKLVNDSLGHPTADSVLVSVGKRIIECVRTGDTVARLGGDEFVLLLEGPVEDSHLVAERVVDAFNEPFLIDGETMLVRPSVGIAVASAEETDLAAEVLVKRADVAMYAAKRARSMGLHSFSAEMTLADPDPIGVSTGTVLSRPAGDGAAQVRLLGELRQAVDRGGLDLVYQPKLDLRTDRIVGLEALLRWPHPQLGVLPPAEFMSLVRQHGLMRQVTDLVLTKALDDAQRWMALGFGTSIAVNVFAPFLRDATLPDALSAALRQRALPEELLTVEITEDLMLKDITGVAAVLHRIRGHGIRVAIDDFGSGYSALSYLHDLPIDEVKLDRSFISSVAEDERAAAVVRAVIDLNHELGITVVAEGVEDADTADWLRRHGCDIGQGFYFGVPVAASAIPDLIRPGHMFDAGTIAR